MRTRAVLVATTLAAASALLGTARTRSVARVDAGEPGAVTTASLDVLVMDEKDRPLEGAVVWAPGTKLTTPVPAEPVVLDQKGLEFRPRFLVARRGQKLLVTNGDPEAHNVHSSDSCCEWNVAVGIGNKVERVLDRAGEATFLCDIHAHMRCTLVVLDAIHARTDAEGRARLELPPGPRKLRARALDRDRAEIEVNVGAVASARIVIPQPARAPLVVPPEKLPWPTVAVRLREALDDAVRFARRGDGASAREAVERAAGEWFKGSELYIAVRDARGRPAAEELKSGLLRLAPKAQAAAEKGGAAVDELAKQAGELADSVDGIARELPKR